MEKPELLLSDVEDFVAQIKLKAVRTYSILLTRPPLSE